MVTKKNSLSVPVSHSYAHTKAHTHTDARTVSHLCGETVTHKYTYKHTHIESAHSSSENNFGRFRIKRNLCVQYVTTFKL